MTGSRRYLLGTVLLGPAVFGGGTAHAAPAAPAAPAALSTTLFDDIVVTASRNSAASVAPSQTPREAIEPQSIVTQRFIDDFIPVSGDYSQTIKFTPSFSFSAPNGAGGSESKSQVLRGFADGQYNVTIDGIPFGDSNDFTHHTTSFFPAGVLGTVTVDRGPGQASTIGYATFGGSVALHSRLLAERMSGLAEVGFGSNGDKVGRIEAQTGSLNSSGTRFLVDYLIHATDGALQYAGLTTQQAVFKFEQPLGSDWDVGVFASYNHTGYENWSGITPNQLALYGKDFGALNNNPKSILYRGYNVKTKDTDFEYIQLKGELASIKIENKLYTFSYGNTEHNGDNQTDLGLVPSVPTPGFGTPAGPKGNLDVRGNVTFNGYRDYGDIFDASRAFAAGVASGTLTAGVWYEHQDNRRYLQNVDWTLGGIPSVAPGADPVGFFGKNALGQTGTGSFSYNLYSYVDTTQPFVQYEWTPTDTLKITPGFKHIDFSRYQVGPVNQTSLLPINYKAEYAASLGYLSANWKILPTTSVYAEIAQGFLAPNANLLYTPIVTRNTFAPQKTLNYQAGAVYSSARAVLSFDAYYIDFNNFITTAIDFTTTPNQTYSINGGGVVYKGLEAEATVVVGRGFSLFVGGSLNSAKTKGSNQRAGEDLWVAGAPDFTAAAGPIYDSATLYGSLLTKVVGSRYFGANRINLAQVNGQAVPTAAAQIVDPVTGISYNSNRLGPYSTTDLTIGYRFAMLRPAVKHLRVEFQMLNVLDSRRATDTNGRLLAKAGDAIDPAATTFQYLTGRAFYGSVTLEF